MQPTNDINRLFLIVLIFGILTTVVQADESISEKTEATVNDVSHAVEASQYVKDKAKQIKNKIDTDNK